MAPDCLHPAAGSEQPSRTRAGRTRLGKSLEQRVAVIGSKDFASDPVLDASGPVIEGNPGDGDVWHISGQ